MTVEVWKCPYCGQRAVTGDPKNADDARWAKLLGTTFVDPDAHIVLVHGPTVGFTPDRLAGISTRKAASQVEKLIRRARRG